MLFQNIFSADRNELMREQMRLEKAQKNNAKEVENSKDSRTQQKRKKPEGVSDGQNKKRSKQRAIRRMNKRQQIQMAKRKRRSKPRVIRRKIKRGRNLYWKQEKLRQHPDWRLLRTAKQSLRSSDLHQNQFFGPIPLSQSDPLHKSLLLQS